VALTKPSPQVGKCAWVKDDIALIRAWADPTDMPIDMIVATSATASFFNMFLSLVWFSHSRSMCE
jgi:hypothetical protein